MSLNNKSFVIYILLILLLLFSVYKIWESRIMINQLKELNIVKTEQLIINQDLENKYRLRKNSKNNFQNNLEIKADNNQILEEIDRLQLNLIDFSTYNNEINLNLKGNFNSILTLMAFLENNNLKIVEFNLKKNVDSLLVFLKLN